MQQTAAPARKLSPGRSHILQLVLKPSRGSRLQAQAKLSCCACLHELQIAAQRTAVYLPEQGNATVSELQTSKRFFMHHNFRDPHSSQLRKHTRGPRSRRARLVIGMSMAQAPYDEGEHVVPVVRHVRIPRPTWASLPIS